LGAKDDGTDNYALLNNLFNVQLAVGGGSVVVPAGTYAVGSNLTVPANIHLEFARGAKLQPASGKKITLQGGDMVAGRYQIFDYSAGGTVAYTGGLPDSLYPEWFGATGDGVTDDLPAFNRM